MHSSIPSTGDLVFDPHRTTVIFSGGGTGGHLYPALALAEALEGLRADLRPVFVGADRGIEARVLPERGVEHLLLPVEGLRRDRVLANLRVVALLLVALFRTVALFRRLRPELVVVTGGYAGGPAGIVAGILGIRLVVQEQNAEPGLTTRLLARRAERIAVAFPEAIRRLPRRARSRAHVTGNPVRPPIAIDRAAAAAHFELDPGLPVVLVVGGSQGATALNEALMDLLRGLARQAIEPLPPLQILWATGPTHFDTVVSELEGEGIPEWVRIVGYIEAMPRALALAEVAISRAGAMATSEFLAWGIPAILIPLPTAAADHQTVNARALEEGGAARCLLQSEVSGVRLRDLLVEITGNPDLRARMARAARERGRPDAVHEVAGELAALLPPPPPAGRSR